MAAFGTKAISYHENRADPGEDEYGNPINYAWDVRYDLSFLNNDSLTTIKVDLVGDPAGSLEAVWLNGVNNIWNNKAFLQDSSRLYEVKTSFSFVNSGAHQTVTVEDGTGRSSMLKWYTDEAGWPDTAEDEIAAHEVGHMFGLFDEYANGATYGGYTTTGTLMSDLTQAGFGYYCWPQEYYTEFYGGMSLNRVLGKTGTSGGNTLNGGSGMDGFYGLGGNDTISGAGANDLLDGGAGKDALSGGSGKDIFDYDAASESGNAVTSRDVIKDFIHLTDIIDMTGMDASSILSGNNAFNWRGASAITTNTQGELRFQRYDNSGTSNDYTIVYGDTDGDTASEFQIECSGLINLTSADFLL